jgi:4-hydroxy-3-methylbut-2-enyl diphosphate reductase
MSVIIDDNAGFCFGVVKAIAAAEEKLAAGNGLYCLGDIVHNNEEVRRLSLMGLHVIGHDDLEHLPDSTVLIRAHGEPPSTYQKARSQNINLIDATCPIVLALQKKVREGYESMRNNNGQVVIFGKPGHAEVIGLNGQTDNTAIIVPSPDDVSEIDFTRPIRLYSQTTKSREDYGRLVATIERKIKETGIANPDFVAHNTICSRVANRAKQLESFARSVDLLLFVSGKNSSNGHYLYEYCLKVQPNTRMIAAASEVQSEWLKDIDRIGITGATSTPRWLMEQVRDRVEKESL